MAPSKPIAPAALAALERAFAADPASDAWRPLAEAYLSLGRFMEAMVVCRRGLKRQPNEAAPRVLLARIHAAQGREQKALEELDAALKVAPADVAALRMAGLTRLQLGERDAGVAALRRAFELAPEDADTLEALRASGLDFTPPAPPSPPPVMTPAAAPAAAARPGPEARSADGRSPPASAEGVAAPLATGGQAPGAVPGQDASGEEGAAGAQLASPAAAAAPPRPVRNAAYAEELASRYATREYELGPSPGRAPRRLRSRAALVSTLTVGAVLLVALVVWAVASSIRKARAVEMERLLVQSRELIDRDGSASYQQAARLAQQVLERDPESMSGHAFLAYVDALRLVEHGESEGLREEALRHLEALSKLGKTHSHAYAARAYLDAQAGEGERAAEALRKVLSGQEGASGLLHGALGTLLLRAGDLDGARQELTLAHRIAQDDVRVTALLAESWRRRGAGFEVQAGALYDAALARVPDHVPSLLGKAQLLLEAGKGGEAAKRVQRVLDLGAAAASSRQLATATALRGAVLHAEGKAAEGDRDEAQGLALDPGNGDLEDLVGRRKLRAGDPSGAAESFARAVKLEPGRVGFYVDLAGALVQRVGGAREAVEVLEQATAQAPGSRVAKLLGDAYRAAGDADKARAAYERALEGEPRFTEARVALARLHRQAKDYAKALEELDRAVKDAGEKGPGAAAALVERAETLDARGDAAEAVEKAYASALEADPQSCPALFWIGRSRSAKKGPGYDRAFATQTLEAYLKACPSGPHSTDAKELLAGLR